jgi:hypothetical protein
LLAERLSRALNVAQEPRGHDADRGYDTLYELFDSPAMQEVRREAHGTDLGCGPGSPSDAPCGALIASAAGLPATRDSLSRGWAMADLQSTGNTTWHFA